jgi:ElaB/YqjD/DUF883 family membrane-anchored ribosome-binding protein
MINSTRTSIGAQVSDAAGAALEATSQALDAGRQFAAEASGRIAHSTRELREGADDLSRRGVESVGRAAGAARRQLGGYAGATRRYIGDEPLKSALIAAGVGAAAAMVLMALTRKRNDRE